MSTDLKALWNDIQSGDTHAIASHLFPKGPQQPMPGIPALVEGPSTTAGIGTADAGTPIVRYWTVKYRYSGSSLWNYTAVIACGPFQAALVVNKRKPSITEAEVVREIQRDEFEHLTRGSP